MKKLTFDLQGQAEVSIILDNSFYREYKDEIFKVNWNGSCWVAYIIRKTKKITISRLITNCPKNMVVDHINGNSLDNRKKNLRICTRQQNSFNQRKRKNTVSKYKGVRKVHSKRLKNVIWRAAIVYKGEHIHLGTFLNQKEAAKAYDKKALALFGEYANINFKEVNNVSTK